MQDHIERPYVSLIYDHFHFWNTIPWSATFLLFQKRMESRQRKKMPPRHSGLKISPVTTLRATRSLRSLRQALRLTPPAKFSPFGHQPPFKEAGSCTSAGLVSGMRCGLHSRHERLVHTSASPHRNDCLSLHARRNFVSRASTLPYGSAFPHTGADPHTLPPLLLHA